VPGLIVQDSDVARDADTRYVENFALRAQDPALQAKSKIAPEKIFHLHASAPGIIGLNVIFAVIREFIDSPDADAPFRIAIPFA
jgi:hypothetical protein